MVIEFDIAGFRSKIILANENAMNPTIFIENVGAGRNGIIISNTEGMD